MPGRTCSYMPVMPAPPSNRLRVGDPYRPSLQASFDGRMRCHYGITARRATLRARQPGGCRFANEGRTATAGALRDLTVRIGPRTTWRRHALLGYSGGGRV